MSAQATSSIQCPAIESRQAELTSGAPLVFVASAALLATIAFIMPISTSWNRSSFETYDFGLRQMEEVVSEGTMSRAVALSCLGMFGIAAVVWPGGKPLRLGGLLGVLCVAYIVYSAASCLWADEFSTSSRRWIAFAFELAAGLGVAKHATGRQLAWIVLTCTLAWLGLGIAAELAHGTLQPWREGYRFAGIFHPNGMGVSCALMVISALYLSSGRRGKSWLYAIALIGLVFMLLTGSRTAIGALLVSGAILWALVSPYSRIISRAALALLVAACVLIAVGLGTFDASQELVDFGRFDETASSLTGRIPLWQELIGDYALRRPVLGYGYGSFWTAGRVVDVSVSQGWPISETHSAYIDLVLNVGLIGAALCLTAMLMALGTAMRLERRHPHAGFGLIAALITFVLVNGLLETTIGITWFLSFFSICGIWFLVLQREPQTQQDMPSHEAWRLGTDRVFHRTATAT